MNRGQRATCLLLLACLAFACMGTWAGEAGAPSVEGAAGPGQEEADPKPEAGQAAERTAPEPELPPEVARVLGKLDEVSRALEDVTAGLVYEESIPLLERTKRSRGVLKFKKPNRIAIRRGRPHRDEVYTDGKLWWVVSHADKQVQIFKADPEGGAQEAAFLKFGYGAGTQDLVKDYHIELVGQHKDEKSGETVYRLEFVPRRKPGLRPEYKSIAVELSDVRWLPHVLVLEQKDGQIVHTYRLSNIKTNTGIKDSAFEYEPPRGYRVDRHDGTPRPPGD